LSQQESEKIGELVIQGVTAQGAADPLRSLCRLIERYPACMVVWLARRAGEAYESGAFWVKFGAQIGIEVPVAGRDDFARLFSDASKRAMSNWFPPQEKGGHNFVAQFLHQAGLPLDRCAGFAQHVRKVERRLGLPEADALDAGEQLRDAMLDSLQSIPVPTLKRALRGPAGPRICEVALNVVLKGNYAGINPRLGQELERVFQDVPSGALRRSAHQAFLRLGDDFGSVELVGPRQDATLVAPGGLTWVVDGRRFPTPRTEEFVLNVTDHPRVVLELLGLVPGALPPRAFVLRLEDLAEGPFLLFEERTKRQRRADGSLPPGRYWMLHRAADTLVGAMERYEWADGKRALSLFEARPGAEVKLDSGLGGPWSFGAALIPFFDVLGDRVGHEGSEPICFRWSEMPFVWLPSEETEADVLGEWRVHVRTGQDEIDCGLGLTGETVGRMSRCQVLSASHPASLPAGLHRIELSLRRQGRVRPAAHESFLYWQGLTRYDAKAFHLAQRPENLVWSDCQGFEFGGQVLGHLSDNHRRHSLCFDMGGQRQTFHWSQPGVFLESLHRRAGDRAVVRSHALGEAFSSGLKSDLWLRIWLAGQRGWEITVRGRPWQHDIGGDRRGFIELSLATMATAFPEGGDVHLRIGGVERLVARFTHPLRPLSVEPLGDHAYKGFRFNFAESVPWVRLVVRDLASGRQHAEEGQRFGESGQCMFAPSATVRVKCSDLVEGESLQGLAGHPLTLLVSDRGWPQGLWLIELEVRRDDNADWEPVLLNGRDQAPVVVCAPYTDEAPTATRERLLWASSELGSPLPDNFAMDDDGHGQLVDLLADLIALSDRTAADARREMGWLNVAMRSLSQLAGKVAKQADSEGLQARLLNLACQDSRHAGFIYLPGLLALPAGHYRELPAGDPLNDALRRCGRLAGADSVAECVQGDLAFLDLKVISCFSNSKEVFSASEGSPPPEFNRFDYRAYWDAVLGNPRRGSLAPDWSHDEALGRKHFQFALEQLERGYDNPGQSHHLAAANALLNCAPHFRIWLHEQLTSKAVMPANAWMKPWPHYEAAEDFLECTPRFTSLFALAARAGAAGWLNFDEAMIWLASKVKQRWMAEEGIAVLVGLAPELFGHQLLFWEMVLRTTPREDI